MLGRQARKCPLRCILYIACRNQYQVTCSHIRSKRVAFYSVFCSAFKAIHCLSQHGSLPNTLSDETLLWMHPTKSLNTASSGQDTLHSKALLHGGHFYLALVQHTYNKRALSAAANGPLAFASNCLCIYIRKKQVFDGTGGEKVGISPEAKGETCITNASPKVWSF